MPWASPEAEADYKARCDRLIACWELREPDRVPISINAGWWPVNRAGLTPYDAMNDKAAEAMRGLGRLQRQTFQPDAMVSPVLYTTPSAVFEDIDYKLYSWPGHGVAKEASYQYNEKEWMLADEYDHFISDPSDYLLRVYLPRTVGAFAGFAQMTSLFDYIELPFVANQVGGWGTPEMAEGLAKLAEAAKAVADWHGLMFPTLGKLDGHGLPGLLRRRQQGSVRHPGRYPARHARGDHRHVPAAGEGHRGLRAAGAGRHRLGAQASGRPGHPGRSSCRCTRAPTAS